MKKKQTILCLSFFFATAVYAQIERLPEVKIKHTNPTSYEIPEGNSDYSSSRNAFDTIWYEDFSNGLNNWTQAGTNQIWKKTFHGSTGPFASGPGTTPPTINSTTKLNGCVMFDADSANNALHPTTPAGSTYTNLSGSIISPSIDLTGYQSVIISFQQFFRLCCVQETSLLTLSVSNDGGTSWHDFDCKGNVQLNSANQSVAVPNVPTSINISAFAANQSDVKIKFTFSAETYFWQIDDIVLSEGPDNDMVNQKSFADFSYPNGGYYTITPRKQVVPIAFRSGIFNNGVLAQTNVGLNVDISNGASSVFNQTSNIIASSPSLGIDTPAIATQFTPSSLVAANYTATFTITQTEADQVPSNNSLTKNFATSDTVYARDNGLTGTANIGPGNYIDGNIDGAAMANLFEFPFVAKATSISVFIDDKTALNTSIQAGIWDANGTVVVSATPVAESDIYDIIAPGDKNKWVTLPLTDHFTLIQNGTYLAGVMTFGVSAGIPVLFRNDIVTEQPHQTSFVLVGSPVLTWGWVSTLPAIRLNIEAPDVNVNEVVTNGLKLAQNMPNPTNSNTFVNYEIVNTADVNLSVYDITGKKLMAIVEGIKHAGKHSIEIDATELNAGIYFYTLKAGDYSLTKKMTVIK